MPDKKNNSTDINIDGNTGAEMVASPWAWSIEEVLEKLRSSKTGLGENEAKQRLAEYGTNVFHNKEKIGMLSVFFKQFLSPLIFLLIAAAILTSILYEWADTIVIVLAILLNVSLGFYHEYHAENTLDKLKTYIKDKVRVIREGYEKEIDPSLLVLGDAVKLAYGTRVPADVRIIEATNFSVDESILTGESLPVEKKDGIMDSVALVSERSNTAYAGTLVVQGYGTGIVYATGNNTEIGKIAGIVSKTSRAKTPLEKGIGHLAWIIFIIVIVLVLIILILGISRGAPLIPMLILSSAVAVGAVPEALPIVLTVILAIGAERIALKKGIIRKLSAAETLGSATIIMTDKTGTLTLADMQLVGIYGIDTIAGNGKAPTDQKEFSSEQKNLLGMALLNVDVSIENREAPKSEWIFRGRPFEVNIAKASRSNDVSLDAILGVASPMVFPFNSTDKFSVAEKDSMYVVMGAPDVLLQKSDVPKEEREKIEKWTEETSRDGKRLLGLATFPKNSDKKILREDISGLKFLGMLAFYDPIRPEVPAAIKNIESHGIKMVLLTGDLLGTALSVAKSLDWEVKDDEAITGGDLRHLSDAKLIPLLSKIKIFARVTPEDKLRIGKLYQGLGEIVAMTGDGVNDAPALKAMDIGISLGSGSDVAKSAADLVLLDDNFETISLAIVEGRRIMSNIRKSFTYLLSNSFDEVFVIGGSLLISLPLPISALQIIWVNLFTGSLPALAYAFDENMDQENISAKNGSTIFTGKVKVLIFGVGILSSLLLFVFYYFFLKIGLNIDLARSIFFVCFSSYILAISFSFRSLDKPLFSYPIFANQKLNFSIIIAIIILVTTMTIPFIRNIFKIAPLPLAWLPFVLFWLMLNIAIVEGAKYILRKN